jgi:hypothetical protein
MAESWRVEEYWSPIAGTVFHVCGPHGIVVKILEQKDADNCALAFNAFDVMMRRRNIHVRPEDDGFVAWLDDTDEDGGSSEMIGLVHDDPFTALIEADKLLSDDPSLATSSTEST